MARRTQQVALARRTVARRTSHVAQRAASAFITAALNTSPEFQ